MPRCEGCSDGPGHHQQCPEDRNDSTVDRSQGDLMLCDSCELYRFPVLAAAGSKMDVKKSNRTTSRCKYSSEDAGCNATQAKPQSVPTTGAKRDASAADLLGRPTVAEVPVVGGPNNKHGSSYKRIVLNELLAYVCF